MAPSLSRDTVESIANETIQSYIKGSSFIDTVRQAVKYAVQEKLNEFINRIEINESKILDLESHLGKREKEITELKSVIETQQNTLDTVERAVNNQEQYSRRKGPISLAETSPRLPRPRLISRGDSGDSGDQK